MTVQQDKIESIFNAALEEKTAADRAAYVTGACGDDADLRERVEALLHAHKDAGSFLLAATVDNPTESPGERIGHYKLLQEIGEGGFGTVYMAEQEKPVRRKVALKIIKLGMDTKQVIARFEAERQALAMMEHSNIAKVFDAGSTDTGRLYFVMELVKGVPITEYCDKNNLDTEARLHLFMNVCSAIQHAHQKGVIHRDIKPSNVMVTLHDGQPVPKVIDFGISKATNQRLTEKTLFTEYHQLIGTPQYMSPEQAEMSGLDIDTRSDLYSLGALLYELLTGTPPFEARTLKEAGYADMQRIICEVEPPKPSTRVATLMQTDTDVAKHRSVEPQSLTKLIRGDLDWIVMKAMEKDRTRRYDTALELMSDIQRHLNNEPVIAGPPGVSYRLSKYVRRNRMAVVAASLVAVALLAGCILATIGFVHASKQRDEAQQARDEVSRQRDEARLARDEAEKARDDARRAKEMADAEAKRSQEIADFLQDMLVSTDPEEAARLNVDVANVVETAKNVFGGDHATVAATLSSLATQLQGAGRYDEAEPLHREAIHIWQEHYGNDHANVGVALTRLGGLLHLKGDDLAAEDIYREALRITKLHAPESVAIADTLMGLGDVLQNKGAYSEAEAAFRESARIRRIVAPDQHFVIALTVNAVANAVVFQGRSDEIEDELLEVVEAFRRAVPADSNLMAKVAVQVGLFYGQRKDYAMAEKFLREALEIYRGNTNPSLAYRDIALRNLAGIIDERDDGTREYMEKRLEFVAYARAICGDDHSGIAMLLAQCAKELANAGRSGQAIEMAVEALDNLKNTNDNRRHVDAANTALRFATRAIAINPERPAADYAAARKAVDHCLQKTPDNMIMAGTRGILLYRDGKVEEALPLLNQSLAHLATQGGVDVELLAVIAMAQHRLGKLNEAKQTHARVRAMFDPEKEKKKKARLALLAEAAALIDGDAPPEK